MNQFRIDHLFLNFEDANLIDSYKLNHDANPDMFDGIVIAQLDQLVAGFLEDLKGSYPLTLEMLRRRKWYVKVICSIARLLAPIL